LRDDSNPPGAGARAGSGRAIRAGPSRCEAANGNLLLDFPVRALGEIDRVHPARAEQPDHTVRSARTRPASFGSAKQLGRCQNTLLKARTLVASKSAGTPLQREDRPRSSVRRKSGRVRQP
jgi:hypothetical protein